MLRPCPRTAPWCLIRTPINIISWSRSRRCGIRHFLTSISPSDVPKVLYYQNTSIRCIPRPWDRCVPHIHDIGVPFLGKRIYDCGAARQLKIHPPTITNYRYFLPCLRDSSGHRTLGIDLHVGLPISFFLSKPGFGWGTRREVVLENEDPLMKK